MSKLVTIKRHSDVLRRRIFFTTDMLRFAKLPALNIKEVKNAEQQAQESMTRNDTQMPQP